MERNQKGKLPWAIVLLIIAFSCVIAYSGALIYSRVSHSGAFSRYRVKQLQSVVELEAVRDGVVYYDGSSVAKLATDTSTVWSYLLGADAQFDATEHGVAAWVGKMLTMIDSKTGVTGYSGNMEGDILSAHVGEMYTAVLLGPEHNSTVVLMENGGRRIDSITLPGQTVIDYGFFSGGTIFWVMALDTNGTVPSCTISTYKPGKRMVGSIHDTEQVMYRVMVLQPSSQIVCVGETHLKTYSYTGAEEKDKRKLTYGWFMVDCDDKSDLPMMAFAPNSQCDGMSDIVDVRMIRGSAEQTVRMPFACASLVARGNRVYGFSKDGAVMIAQMGQQKVTAYQIPFQIEKVYGIAEGNVAILGNGTSIYFLTLE